MFRTRMFLHENGSIHRDDLFASRLVDVLASIFQARGAGLLRSGSERSSGQPRFRSLQTGKPSHRHSWPLVPYASPDWLLA